MHLCQDVYIHIAYESNISLTLMTQCYLSLQYHVLMVISGFKTVQAFMKVEWKSVIIMLGALSVMTFGVLLMQELHVDSLDLHQQV